MQVETEEIEYCKLRIKYEADPEIVREKQQEAIVQLRKLNMPGYRPGKAPDFAIKARCKTQIKNWVRKEMSSQAYDDILFETKFRPIGLPKFENIDLKNDQFRCEVLLAKKPDFELKEYKEFEIPKPHIEKDVEAEVQKTLQDLRIRFGDIEPYKETDFVQDGDQITMDFEALIDGEAFDGSVKQGELYSVGEGRWSGFDENLLGAVPGEEREFELTFAENVPNIGGKSAKFKVLIHMGMKKIPAALDDDLAQKVGLKNFDEVKEKLAVIANEKIRRTEQKLIRQQVTNHLVNAHDFEIPGFLLKAEAEQIAAQNQIYWESLGEDEKQVFLDQGTKSLKLSLILDSIREVEAETVLSDAEALESIKSQVAAQGGIATQFLVESQKNGRLPHLVSAMKDEFTLQWVMDKCKIIDA